MQNREQLAKLLTQLNNLTTEDLAKTQLVLASFNKRFDQRPATEKDFQEVLKNIPANVRQVMTGIRTAYQVLGKDLKSDAAQILTNNLRDSLPDDMVGVGYQASAKANFLSESFEPFQTVFYIVPFYDAINQKRQLLSGTTAQAEKN